MAVSLLNVRRLVWLLLLCAVVVVTSGCAQRDEANPFIGPKGDALSQPFG